MEKKLTFSIQAQPNFVYEQSDPSIHKYVWSYEIKIINESEHIIQLLNRYWRITDMTGKVEEIHGVGVVGLQPLLMPKKIFTYTSFCQLTTPQGAMEGHYIMQDLEEHHFKVNVPKFALVAPMNMSQSFKSILH